MQIGVSHARVFEHDQISMFVVEIPGHQVLPGQEPREVDTSLALVMVDASQVMLVVCHFAPRMNLI